MDDVVAILLAGGLGTRLRSVVSDRPKVLAPVAGEPFIMHLLRQIERAGVRRCVISTGYMADLVEQTVGPALGAMAISYVAENQLLGTGGALRFAALSVTAPRYLVLNADSYIDCDFAAFLATAHPASIVVTPVDDTSRFGRLEFDASGKISAFIEKAAASGPGWINAGVYCFDRAIVESFPTHTPMSLEREVFPLLIESGLSAYRCKGTFIDIGTPESYQRAEAIFAPGS